MTQLPQGMPEPDMADMEWLVSNAEGMIRGGEFKALRNWAVSFGLACYQAGIDAARTAALSTGGEAWEAAEMPDVSHHDKHSYVCGYQDACVDCDEAIAAIRSAKP